MGSRIMHYGISHKIAQVIDTADYDAFLLGGIIPDIHPFSTVPKSITHFIQRDENGKGHIRYLDFFEKYRTRMQEPFFLAYLCHLISDHIWSTTMFSAKVQSLTADEKKQKLAVCYRDFWRLNGVIIRREGLQHRELTFACKDIEELDAEAVPSVLQALAKDFRYEETTAGEPLEFLSYEEVFDFMDRSVTTCLEFISGHGASKINTQTKNY